MAWQRKGLLAVKRGPRGIGMLVVDPHTPGLDLAPGPVGGVAVAGSFDCQNCSPLSELFIFSAYKTALKIPSEPLLGSGRDRMQGRHPSICRGPAALCSELCRRGAGHIHPVRVEKTTSRNSCRRVFYEYLLEKFGALISHCS
jgi:hypothetical protein